MTTLPISGASWKVRCASAAAVSLAHEAIKKQMQRRQTAVARSRIYFTVLKLEWKKEATQSQVLHYLKDHLPMKVYNDCDVNPCEADTSDSVLAVRGHLLQDSNFQKFTRQAIAKLLAAPGFTDDWHGLMDEVVWSYVMARECRAELKSFLPETHCDDLLERFCNLLRDVLWTPSAPVLVTSATSTYIIHQHPPTVCCLFHKESTDHGHDHL